MCLDIYSVKKYLSTLNLPEDFRITVNDNSRHEESYYFTLGVEGKDPVASFYLKPLSRTPQMMESYCTYVAFDKRGRGYGTLLQEIKLGLAKTFQFSLIAVVNISNEIQVHLLEKFGWVENKVAPLYSLWYLDYRTLGEDK